MNWLIVLFRSSLMVMIYVCLLSFTKGSLLKYTTMVVDLSSSPSLSNFVFCIWKNYYYCKLMSFQSSCLICFAKMKHLSITLMIFLPLESDINKAATAFF